LSPEQTLLARYLGYLLPEFDQTFTTNEFFSKDEHVNFWGQKVNGQGHSVVKYSPKMHFLALLHEILSGSFLLDGNEGIIVTES